MLLFIAPIALAPIPDVSVHAQATSVLVYVHPEFHLPDRLTPQRIERPLLLRGERSPNTIEYTDAAKGVAIMHDERRSHVEANPWFANNERVVAKALVRQRVCNDEHVVLLDRVNTKSDAARGFGRAHAEP